ncbi:MAG TPA: M28 family metallopeptidase [Pseudonocardiaceae bacterium]
MFSSRWQRTAVIATSAAVTLALAATPASAGRDNPDLPDGPRLARQLVKDVTGDNAHRHLRAFQRIGDTYGSRATNTPGYDASVEYVAGKLRDAGYLVSTPSFNYDEEVNDAEVVSVGGQNYTLVKMQYSPLTPVGGITAPLALVPQDADPGCTMADFAGQDFTGRIAMIRRGGCAFEIKQLNAAAAGAVAVVVLNNQPGDRFVGTLGSPASGRIPTGTVKQTDGDILAGLAGSTATVDLRSHLETRTSRNVLAQTRQGRTDNVVMAGAHLDSVPEGPGINDNGTGSAALLETALQLGGRAKVRNAVRFAWWGTEEEGLIGSEAYVAGLSFEEQLDIALYLNFDMIGSPNAAYFVYDGDNSDGVGAGPGPFGSAQIEQTFAGFLGAIGVQTEGTDFTGRSDYGPFIAVGIPAGGLFTGAEGVKTAAQAAKWGGTAGIAYDPCYHAACDTLGNVDRTAFDRNADAMAWSVGLYATSTEDVNGVPSRTARASLRATAARAAAAAPHSHASAA